MVWNKDLAKLKQELKSEEGSEPKKPAPKPVPKPAAPKELEDEDALFLAAMGKRKIPSPANLELGEPEPRKAAPPAPPAAPDDFKEAMASLKGMKPVQSARVGAEKQTPPSTPKPPVAPPPVEVPEEPAATPEPAVQAASAAEPPRAAPMLIQLAAGMAIEVDGGLDLRGHSPADALERLKERILDGHLLGWRTLHVQLGPSEELRQTLLDYLAGSESELVIRYAQAPIPMGGAQAWILYLGLPTHPAH